MTKRKIFIGVVVCLLAVILCCPVGAETPAGEAALNFCALGSDGEPLTWVFESVNSNVTDTSEWVEADGSMLLELDALIRPNETFKVKVYPTITEYLRLLPYRNEASTYYGANQIHLWSDSLSSWYVFDLTSMTVYFEGGETANLVTGAEGYYDWDKVVQIDFAYHVGRTVVSGPVEVNEGFILSTTILQDLRIEEITGTNSDYLTHDFVPYNPQWFMSIGGFTQEDIDRARADGYEIGYQEGFRNGSDTTNTDEVVNANWTGFVFNALNGVLEFEILPGLPLWGMLSAVVAIPLLIMFLKMFMGG